MPSLDAILADTMLLGAELTGLERYDVAPAPPARPLSRARVLYVDAPDDAPVTADAAIWSFWVDGDPARVLDVTCKVPARERPDVPSHELGVCSEVRWDAPAVVLRGARVPLPLDRAHLLRVYLARGGVLPARGCGLWPLGAPLDAGLLAVYGFELTPEGAVHALTAAQCARDDLMPDDGAPAAPDAPVRVVVAVEFVTCRPARDYDPWGLLLAARLHPHLMLMASAALDGFEAAAVLARPEGTDMIGCFADLEQAWRSRAGPRFECALGAVSNAASPSAALPTWERAFDYAQVGARGEAHVVVDPARPARACAPALCLHRGREVGDAGPVMTAAEHSFAKAGRQGAFDGLVLAPPLRAPPAVEARLRGWRVDAVTPLPVADHDALHMYWRWGEALGAAPRFAGWSASFEPNRTPGAPMVPPDQRVTVRAEGASLSYQASCEGPVAASRWQVVLHHGLAFGLEIARGEGSTAAEGLAALLREAPVVPDDVPVAVDAHWLLHWALRYCSTAAYGPVERLQVLDLARARSG